MDDEELATVWGLVSEAHAEVTRRVFGAVQAEVGVAPAEFEILLRLSRSGGGLPAGELARQVSFSAGGLTKAVDRLTGRGWVRRTSGPADRRVVTVSITDPGTLVVGEALRLQGEGLRRHVVEPLGVEGVGGLVRLMRALLDAARSA